MDLGALFVQNFFGLVATVIGGLILAFARRILVSSKKTEQHAEDTALRLSQLDTVSVSSHNAGLEQWQRDMALRIEAAADSTSDSLAWQAKRDREAAQILHELEHMRARMAAVEKFARDLDAYAHGHTGTPTYTPPTTAPIRTTTEEPHELVH